MRKIKRQIRAAKRSIFTFANGITFLLITNKKKIVNKKEVRIIGMQRTGNHAIVNWIYSQCDELKCVLNNVKVNTNPFLTFKKKGTIKEFDQNFLQKINLSAERLGFFSEKELLLYTYEDEMAEAVFNDNHEARHDRQVGRTEYIYDLVILRDPFNLFASRLKRDDNNIKNRFSLREKQQRHKVINLWKNHAREFIGETNYLKHNKISVNYNRWFADKTYRQKLAEKLNIRFTDESINKVLHVGGGSSFDQTELNNRASEMKVLERWKEYKNDELFISIFQDKEILDLYMQIYDGKPGEPTGGIKEFITTIN